MDWLSPLSACSDGPLPDSGWPRAIVRRLLEIGQAGFGARVLDVGCGEGGLLRLFDHLGLEGSGLDADAGRIDAARRAAPHLSFRTGGAGAPLPYPEREFNLVLARDQAEFAGNLGSIDALLAAARLLAVIRPGGFLLIVTRWDLDEAQDRPAHSDECWTRLGQSLGAGAHTTYLREPRGWRFWSRPRSACQVAAFRVMVKPRSLAEWQRRAIQAARRQPGACCAAAGQAPLREIRARRAA